MVLWLAVTQLEHAESLFRSERRGEAEPLLAGAREVFERLEAALWVARAGAAQALSSGLELEAVGA